MTVIINLALSNQTAEQLETKRQKLGYLTRQEVIREIIAKHLEP